MKFWHFYLITTKFCSRQMLPNHIFILNPLCHQFISRIKLKLPIHGPFPSLSTPHHLCSHLFKNQLEFKGQISQCHLQQFFKKSFVFCFLCITFGNLSVILHTQKKRSHYACEHVSLTSAGWACDGVVSDGKWCCNAVFGKDIISKCLAPSFKLSFEALYLVALESISI